MSYILESIKQAERERKLGQQAPSVSIEYSAEHIEDIENNKIKWVIMSLALLLTAIVVWSATQYFANKDRQYMGQYVEELTFNNESVQEEALLRNNSTEKTVNKSSSNSTNDSGKRDVLMVPVQNVHKSDLKSVKLISAGEAAPKTKIERAVEVKKTVAKKLTNTLASKKVVPELKVSVAPAIEPVIKNVQPIIETSKVADKQQLADIYADLSKRTTQKPLVNEPKFIEAETFKQNSIDEKLVKIETASYVTTNENTLSKVTKPKSNSRPEVTSITPKHAVSTGVPSYGELPYDIQEKIPDFNVSVHMFHADPNQRRIRINGNMYTEGKSLQQDLALLEITRYGAVFDYQGHKFRLNVR